MSAPRRRPRPLSRRDFLRRSAALSAATWVGTSSTRGLRAAWAQTNALVLRPEGTTLERSIWYVDPQAPYSKLTYMPGWPIVVRPDFAEPKAGREDRRVALTAFLHGTDYQFPDAQSPARVEWTARYADEPTPSFLSSAQRPQEALIVHACEAVHRQARAVAAGPVTGRRLDFAMSTGDNYDNKQANELDWFITLMNGGPLAANSGAPDRFEGVQNFDGVFYDDWYYHPDDDLDLPPGAPSLDNYRRRGYPAYPGILEATIQPFTAVGVGTRWFQTYGNHDSLVQGNERVNQAYATVAVGELKHLHPAGPVPNPGAFWHALMSGDPGALAFYVSGPAVPVAADPQRRFIFDRDYVRAHLDSPGQPHGHGFAQWNLDDVYLFYEFDIGPSVVGIALDTCAPQLADGSIGAAQMRWLEQRLVAAHSHHFDAAGNEVATGNDDRLVVIFGHHRFAGVNPFQSPRQIGEAGDDAAPDSFDAADGYKYRLEQQHGGDELLALLHRFPNVVAYVNGHSHRNLVVPHPDPSGRTSGIWEITTSAQLDPPQHARIIELVDNRDGTLSIFTTLIDHAGPPDPGGGSYDVLGLASISRELGFNDYQTDVITAVGGPGDRNVELLLPAPFELFAPVDTEDEAPPVPTPPALPATGAGSLVAGAGIAALAGAIALRERGARRERPSAHDR